MTPSLGGRYVFDTAADAERRRLEAQTELWDPFTFRVLSTTGVTAGWRRLEIGAGTGSVAAWLVDRVGPAGLVVATDVETRWLEPLASPNLVVRHHNVIGALLRHGDIIAVDLHTAILVSVAGADVSPGGCCSRRLRLAVPCRTAHGAWRRVAEATIEVQERPPDPERAVLVVRPWQTPTGDEHFLGSGARGRRPLGHREPAGSGRAGHGEPWTRGRTGRVDGPRSWCRPRPARPR